MYPNYTYLIIEYFVLNFYFFKTFFYSGRFSKSNIGENCSGDFVRIIRTENSCKAAATVIGLSYTFAVSFSSSPAGCYWLSDGDVYFNEIIDPSKTNPGSFGNKGGLCFTNSKQLSCMDANTSLPECGK